MHAEEFKTKVLPLSGSLYRFAKSLLGTSQEAEDCVQDILMKLWVRRESLSSVRNLRAFAMQMTRNLCLDKLKRDKHKMEEIGNDIIEPNRSPYQQVEIRDTINVVEKIIRILPEAQRTIIHLRNVEGLEITEIEEVTSMTAEHIRVTLSRARMAIRQQYQKYLGNE